MSSPRSQEERDMVERIILYAMNDRAVLKDVKRAVKNAYQEYMKELIGEAKEDFKAFEKYIVAEINKRRAPVPERSIRDYMPHDGFPLGDPRYRPDGRYASDSAMDDRVIKQISDRFMGIKTSANKYALVVTFQQYNDRMFELTKLGQSLPDFLKAPLIKEANRLARQCTSEYQGKVKGLEWSAGRNGLGYITYPDDFNDQLDAKNLWGLNDKAFKVLTSQSWLHLDD